MIECVKSVRSLISRTLSLQPFIIIISAFISVNLLANLLAKQSK